MVSSSVFTPRFLLTSLRLRLILFRYPFEKVLDNGNAHPDAGLEARITRRTQRRQGARGRSTRGSSQRGAQGGRRPSAGEAECKQACRSEFGTEGR